ncbi:hypothetical protein [Gracilimonas tropica]|uniref:hypothetical protein n=1 Tax=Gracilimonas tropica TaxID=454600 RepID=UPI00037C09E2|nr:hypothetical protein [Gracilimonas tropica]
MKKQKTDRGFDLYKFEDSYGAKCSMQKSSAAFEDKVWLGVDDPDPKILASQASKFGIKTTKRNGWVEYPIPKEVSMITRMHLNKKQVKSLVWVLIKFLITGRI